MNTAKRQVAVLSLPLALLSFCIITLKTVAHCVDGPVEARFGFPLAWITAGPTSLSFKVDLLAFAMDFGVYLGMWALLLRAASLPAPIMWRRPTHNQQALYRSAFVRGALIRASGGSVESSINSSS